MVLIQKQIDLFFQVPMKISLGRGNKDLPNKGKEQQLRLYSIKLPWWQMVRAAGMADTTQFPPSAAEYFWFKTCVCVILRHDVLCVI